jgi:hypothetical protein
MSDRWFQEHAGDYLKTVGYVWRCGDECQCSQARVENIYTNQVTGPPWIVREHVWDGEFHAGGWEADDETTADEELANYRASLSPERQTEIEWTA